MKELHNFLFEVGRSFDALIKIQLVMQKPLISFNGYFRSIATGAFLTVDLPNRIWLKNRLL